MSNNSSRLAVQNNDKDKTPVQEDSNWSDAPVIDNTGNATVRDFDAASQDHPLVQHAGEKAQKTDIQGGGEFVSEEIYESDDKWVREWLQNEETACIRRCKMVVQLSDEYPDGWLQKKIHINADTGEEVEESDTDKVEVVSLDIPRPIDEVIEAARNLGYDPTIVWDVYRDERKIVTEDNGIGMTPEEFWGAFKSPFSSGSGVDGDTGGNFGIGSNSVEKVHGPEGAAKVYTRPARPGDYEGYQAYSYRGGATAIDGDVEDGFYGTRFEIPVCEDFSILKIQSWVDDFTEQLRIPVLYREHDAGTTVTEEEYESTNFVESYDDPPVVIERPGEFSLVAGPDVYNSSYTSDDENTFLVSMPIDRNTRASISTFWDVVIQIHDEQGRIIAGPNRGFYGHKSKVYATGQNNNMLGELHEDDVVLPTPTGDRDRLKKNQKSTEYFHYIEKIVKNKELESISNIVRRIKDADHPGDAIRNEYGDWLLLRKMFHYHGSRRVTERKKRFEDFIESNDVFPDFDDATLSKFFKLFKEVSYCKNGVGYSSRKSNRTEKRLGYIIAKKGRENIYMAASTGGNFTDRFRVIENTHDDCEVIVISGAGKYEKWNNLFGFKVLKEVPVTQDDSHSYDVPQNVHDNNKKTKKTKSKPNKVEERVLKVRATTDNSSIDIRPTISSVKERLENGGMFGGHSKLVLFPRTGDENISDNYDFADYAAIASVTGKEYDELKDYKNVMTIGEYKSWSQTTLIATTDGAMKPSELVNDDRMVVLAYRRKLSSELVKLMSDEYEELRKLYCEDIHSQVSWAKVLDGFEGGYRGKDKGNVYDDAKPDTLFAVADEKVLNRAEWAFDQMEIASNQMLGIKLTSHKFGYKNPVEWKQLNGRMGLYKLKVKTPNWDNSSQIYDSIPRNLDSREAQMLLGFHDRDVDPSKKSNEELRDLI